MKYFKYLYPAFLPNGWLTALFSLFHFILANDLPSKVTWKRVCVWLNQMSFLGRLSIQTWFSQIPNMLTTMQCCLLKWISTHSSYAQQLCWASMETQKRKDRKVKLFFAFLLLGHPTLVSDLSAPPYLPCIRNSFLSDLFACILVQYFKIVFFFLNHLPWVHLFLMFTWKDGFKKKKFVYLEWSFAASLELRVARPPDGGRGHPLSGLPPSLRSPGWLGWLTREKVKIQHLLPVLHRKWHHNVSDV